MIQIDDHFKNSFRELSHAVFSKEEVIGILNRLQYNVNQQVETLVEEAIDDVKKELKDVSVFDNEVAYKECKRVVKEILDEILDDASNYDISLNHENKVVIEFSGKSTSALAEEILDELNEII